MIALVPLFAVTALLYASVGFGGGSTYTALLAVAEVDYRVLPVVSLVCNILVVTGGAVRFAMSGSLLWERVWPLLVLSVPCAWLGGYIPVPQTVFLAMLAGGLGVAGLLMLREQPAVELQGLSLRAGTVASEPFLHRTVANDGPVEIVADDPAVAAYRPPRSSSAALGGGLGLVSGMVGIGGGIFLAPILHLTNWGTARAIAGTASVFILVNSLAGLAGQVAKRGEVADLVAYLPLFVAVVVFGQVGSWLGATRLSANLLRRATAVLVLFVSARLALRVIEMGINAPGGATA